MRIGKERIILESVDSTNSYAHILAEKGYPHGTVVVADSQTKGRGRQGRKWHSPPHKNIYASLILKPRVGVRESEVLSLLTLMSAVAVSEAIEAKTAIPVRVKWPNDLMVSDERGFKKVGGVLSEARYIGAELGYAVVGIGINVNGSKEDIPQELMETATSLRVAVGRKIDLNELLEGILNSLDGWYCLLFDGHKGRIINRWREISLTIGKEVKAITEDRVIRGLAFDIDDNGRLLLRLSSGDIKTIDSGDIVHLR